MPDATAEMSDLLEREGYALVVPAGRLRPTLPGTRVIGPAMTLRYLPERREPAALRNELPDGQLGNRGLAAIARPGSVMVVQSPRDDVSMLGSEAADMLQRAGIIAAVTDGAVRDTDGLAALGFACWTSGRTPITGRWRLEAVSFGEPVSLSGVQVREGDIVIADDGGVAFVPADRFDELARRLVGR
ncbi:MAG: RraA family protein [Candidatus Limnocylindrales bacterium]